MTHQFHIDRSNLHRLRLSLTALFLFISIFSFSQWQYVGSPEIGRPVNFDAEGNDIYTFTFSGIFHSNNLGVSWSPVPFDQPSVVIRQGVVEDHTLYVLVGDVENESSLLKSEDDGETWVDASPVTKTIYGFDLAIKEDTILLVLFDTLAISYDGGMNYSYSTPGHFQYTFFHNGHWLAEQFGELYESHDQGISWNKIYTSPSDDYVTGFSSAGGFLWKTEGDVNSNLLYISRSEDLGETWLQVFSVSYSDLEYAFPFITGSGDTLFLLDPSSATKLLLSTDRGLNWTAKSILESFENPFVSNHCVFYSSNEGIFVSRNNGSSFQLSNNGFTSAQVSDIFSLEDEIWISAHGKMFRKNITEDEWHLIPNITNIQSTLDGHFIGIDNGVPKRSADGVVWNTIKASDLGLSEYPFFHSINADGTNMYLSGFIYSWQSADNGLSWEETDENVTNVEFNQYYTATSRERKILFSDNGLEWEDYTYDFIGPSDDMPVVFHHGFLFAYPISGLHRLFPLATNWEKLNVPGPISHRHPNHQLKSYGDLLIAGVAGHGVYVSSDNGDTWRASNEGLTNYKNLAMTIAGEDLYLGMQGGVWKRALSELEVSNTENISSSQSFTIFPQPVDEILNLSLDNKTQGQINISIFDVAGYTVISKKFDYSDHIVLNVSHLTSGIYFLQMTIGSKRETVKLIKAAQ